MGIYTDSDYVRNMNARAIDTANKSMEYQNFATKFKDKIANGYSKIDMLREYNCTQSDLDMYDRLEADVAHEQELGNAFEQGLKSVWNK
jgi:hypothetical protein